MAFARDVTVKAAPADAGERECWRGRGRGFWRADVVGTGEEGDAAVSTGGGSRRPNWEIGTDDVGVV
jgi:hypothetical protein